MARNRGRFTSSMGFSTSTSHSLWLLCRFPYAPSFNTTFAINTPNSTPPPAGLKGTKDYLRVWFLCHDFDSKIKYRLKLELSLMMRCSRVCYKGVMEYFDLFALWLQSLNWPFSRDNWVTVTKQTFISGTSARPAMLTKCHFGWSCFRCTFGSLSSSRGLTRFWPSLSFSNCTDVVAEWRLI